MMKHSLYLSILLALITFNSIAQESKYALSEPVDIKESGWNKVLCMKNGNTLLFHFENSKPVVLLVFDSLHKQIASKSYPCNVLEVNKLKETIYQGLFEINNEAVLFMDQAIQSKRSLIRMRFSGTDGVMTEEKRISESPAMSTPTDYTVVHTRDKDNYSIVYCTDKPSFKKCDLHVTFYDNKHEQAKEIPIEVDRKFYDKLGVIGAQEKNDGVCVTIGLANKVADATPAASGNIAFESYHTFLQAFFIAKGSNMANATQILDLSTSVVPANTEYTYNAFANAHNILLFSFKSIVYKKGDEYQPAAEISDLFLKFDAGDFKLNSTWIKNTMANDYLHKNTDSTKFFTGIPLYLSTNDNGLSTLIQESYAMEVDPNPFSTERLKTYMGNIAVTQFDDDGKELWGVVLPKSHCYKSITGFYDITLMSQKNQSQGILADKPEQEYDRQFYTVNTYSRTRIFYMIFNDNNSNFNNTIKNPGDTVGSTEKTNACYYRMDRKKEVTKKHLFGEPAAGEYINSFTEGADFVEKSGMYAALVRCKKGETTTLRMAWAWLD